MDEEIKTLFNEIVRLNPLRTINNCNLGYYCIGKVINYLIEHEYATSGELAENLNVSTARIANVINNMENNKLITRKKDHVDKRKVVVSLSQEGKQTYLQKYNDAYLFFEKLVNEVGIDKMEDFISTAEEIRQKIDYLKKKEGGNNV